MMFNKKRTNPILFLLTFLLFTSICFSQNKKKSGLWKALNTTSNKDSSADVLNEENSIRYEDYVYKPTIKTVQLHDANFEISQPILSLGSEQTLKFSFDDLDFDFKNYNYSFIHCSASWAPDDLVPAEFMEGYPENPITEYQHSLNTLQHFTHYNLIFPNKNLHFTKSGNYILKVYLDGNSDNPVITRRFMIYENKVNIQSKVTPASIIEYRNFKQELDFTINHAGYTISNPYDDLKIVITQNNHWDNAKTNLKPLFVKDNELVYDYDDENVFTGGNEFRYFDIKSIRYHSERIAYVEKDAAGIHVDLLPDEKRTFKRYSTYTDINGNFLIKVQEGTNSELEAEYCYVKFFLTYETPVTDGSLYVFGAFNGWQCTAENLMHYNTKRSGYECTLYLKQGYYNYEYVFLKNGAAETDETLIEGMHYETENDYTIYVYHQQRGTFYDQLIGVRRLNSMR